MTPPCIGFGITVVDTENKRAKWSGRPSLLCAYVTGHPSQSHALGVALQWKCGRRSGTVWMSDEGQTWARGHGPQARTALLAERALRMSR
jgi:hypothetical protein